MELLTKEQFLNQELKKEKFDCTPYGLNGEIIIQELTGRDRDRLEENVMVNGKLQIENLRAKAIALSCINPDGTKMFSIKDAPDLNRRSGKMMVDIYRVIKRLSGLGEDEVNDLVKK